MKSTTVSLVGGLVGLLIVIGVALWDALDSRAALNQSLALLAAERAPTPMTRVCAEGFCSRVWSGYVRDDPGGTWTCSMHTLTWDGTAKATGSVDTCVGGRDTAATTLKIEDDVRLTSSTEWSGVTWEPDFTLGTDGARTPQGRYPIWLGRDRLAGEIGRVDSQIVVWDRHGKVAAQLGAACGECGR